MKRKSRVQAPAQAEAQPATFRQLFEAYVRNLEDRGKGADTVGRAKETQKVIERMMPALLDRAVTEIGEPEIYAFRSAREAAGTRASTINGDLQTIRAMLKKAQPDFRFLCGASTGGVTSQRCSVTDSEARHDASRIGVRIAFDRRTYTGGYARIASFSQSRPEVC